MIDPRKYLDEKQRAEYDAYIAVRNQALKDGTHHWCRIAKSRDEIQTVEVEHCIPYADQYDLDAPLKVCHPSPRCVAELMAGGIHPPIEALNAQRLLFVLDDGSSEVVSRLDAPRFRAQHGERIQHEIVVENSRAHQEAMGPLTYEQAIEWIVLKDIPVDVWGREHNSPQFWIARRDELPATRQYRNAWKLRQDEYQLAA